MSILASPQQNPKSRPTTPPPKASALPIKDRPSGAFYGLVLRRSDKMEFMSERLALIGPERFTRPYILVDLDSTVFNILSPLNKAVYDRYGLNMMEIAAKEKRSYWFPDWPEIRAIKGASAFIYRLFRQPGIFEAAEIIDGASEILNDWRSCDYLIGVRTRRFDLPAIRRATYWSLEQNQLGWLWKNIFWGVSKQVLDGLWQADVAIDDYEPDLEGPAKTRILFGNYFWQEEPGPGILRATNWMAANRIVRAAIMSHNI